jgi:aminoglycoside phosphotransferase (APT) family kinase protein
VTDLPGLDLTRLTDYLAQAAPGLVTGELGAELIAGGRSNLTYRITDGAATSPRWVLRRPPLGHVLATAHDMGREFTVLAALVPTELPAPVPVLLCTDADVLGAPFYLMEHVPGAVLRARGDMERLGPQACTVLGHRLVDVLADLHSIEPDSIGLADFGRPDGYLTRQVARWRKQLDASRSREVAGIDELHERLAASVPDSPKYSLIHGDYRLDNVIVDVDGADGPRIAAVLDWEMATLGDPLADLALLVIYTSGRDEDDPITGGVSGAAGFPKTDELVARYAERTGTDVSALDWYVALGNFKLAVVLEGIHYRFTQGKTVGKGFERIGELVPHLVDGGLAALNAHQSHTSPGR